MTEEDMTLRNYFAGQALSNPALCTGHVGAQQLQEWFGEGATGIPVAEIAARQAYACADAMLRARRDEK